MVNRKTALALLFLVSSFQETFARYRNIPCRDSAQKDPVDYVNPYIGTDKSSHPTMWESHGETFPGVLLPFGMVQITPDAYVYSHTKISSFSFLNHNSGWTAKGSFHLMAYTSGADSPQVMALPAAFSFRHSRERTTPYCYRVRLDDYGIQASFTATTRAG